MLRTRAARLPLTPSDSSRSRHYAEVTDLPVDDPITAGIFEMQDGRAPREGEVLLTAPLARQLGVRLGSILQLAQPPMRAEVVGIARLAERFAEPVLVAPGFDFSIVQPGVRHHPRLLVDLPAGVGAERRGHRPRRQPAARSKRPTVT